MTMPHDPAHCVFSDESDGWQAEVWDWEADNCWEDMSEASVREWARQGLHVNVWLENGQRIVVRALSDERKAKK